MARLVAKNMVITKDKDSMVFAVRRKHNRVTIDCYKDYEFSKTIETDLDKGTELYYNAINNEGYQEAF